MRIFISAGEPSGDLHGSNLAQALQTAQPGVELYGFGGERMAGAGCRLLYPLANHAVMGLTRVLAELPFFWNLVSHYDRWLARHRPDAVVLIDYPGLHWWLARRAHARGIPVFYFVPPQIWAWATHRVKRMQKWVDHVLCALPFEAEWYAQRGVKAHFIGHPYFDELHRHVMDAAFLASQKAHGKTCLGLLPGSRTQEVVQNTATLLDAARRIHRQQPQTRFLVAAFKEKHAAMIRASAAAYADVPLEIHVGRTPEIIRAAHSVIAVSGSVSLELLYHTTPAVTIYRTSPLMLALVRRFKRVPYISLINLLAQRELSPEFLSARHEGPACAAQVLRWLTDPAEHSRVQSALAALRDDVAQPGACARAAAFIQAALTSRGKRRAA
jgi:lipid-A-disaccharide synthase